MKQTLEIKGWHPRTNPNGSHGHYRTHTKNHHIDRDMAWASAKQAGWVFVPGKVRLEITLVYPRKYRLDRDNLFSRVKGCVDGLKGRTVPTGAGHAMQSRAGFFTDDSTEWLDLEVNAVVVPGVKAVRISLEPISQQEGTQG